MYLIAREMLYFIAYMNWNKLLVVRNHVSWFLEYLTLKSFSSVTMESIRKGISTAREDI